MTPTNLHLGCGKKFIPGFIHIDARKFNHSDYVCQLDDLSIFKSDSVDLIYASHVLEHFKRYECKTALREWHRVLRPGGTLRLAVPDFEAIVKIYQEKKDVELLIGLLYGGQDYQYNYHHIVFDFESLSKLLSSVGFVNIHRYDWKQTIHKDYDDYSQAYLPHMDKDHGLLMSLNVECNKK
ncbi:MAG TPA: methyltransferase domain-containing protein [Smithellaceae bacterium]|nr:methyltransferase domain-containing protein [Smithellaceae bacterium]